MPTTRAKSAGRTAPSKRKASTSTAGARKTGAKKASPKKQPAANKPPAKKAARSGRPRAHALHIGLNAVDPRHYAGWSGPLNACEADARDMAAIARQKGMTSTVLMTKEATRQAVLGALRAAARKLAAGDYFFLTYSGHGGQVPDRTQEEADRADETWCLFDAQLIDDELYRELGRFAKGVRICVLSDSCHSGTVVRGAIDAPVHDDRGRPARPKFPPIDIVRKTYAANQRFYDRLQKDVAAASEGGRVVDPDVALAQVAVDPRLGAVTRHFGPTVVLISGCQDNQSSLDGDRNGAFTEQLLKVWGRGAFIGNYGDFHARIKRAMPRSQTPNLFTIGDARTFLGQQPFQVDARPGRRVTPLSAREFVEATSLPAASRTRGAEPKTGTVALTLDAGKDQAAVVGSEIISFVAGVTAERREAILNSSLLAQLVASRKVADTTKVYEWYDEYFNVLANVGWVVQDRGFAEYQESSSDFEAHKAIMAVATTLLGAAPAALAMVKSTLDALHAMNADTPWITIWNRESASTKTARFQVGLAEQDAEGQCFVNLLAFGLEAKTRVTQVLFFRARKQEARFRHYSGRVTINTSVLDTIGAALRTKIAAHSSSYISQLPDL